MRKLIRIHPFVPCIAVVLFLSSCASLYIKNGKESYEQYQYQDAAYFLEKGLKKKEDPQARRMLAESYLMTNQYAKAEANYALSATATDNTDRDRINYGRALMAVGKYNEARTIFEGIVSRDPSNQVAADLLASTKKLNDLKKDSLMYTIEPVNIPNAYGVYSGFPYNGGLVLTIPATKGDKDPYTNKAFTDLFFTKKEGASWSEPVPYENVNGAFHEAVAAVSPNGQTMIFTRSFQLNGGKLASNNQRVSNMQLYMSKIGPDGKPEKPSLVPFCDSKYMYAHPAYSPDGNTLYFSSDMPGGKGEMDIWESKYADGTWGTPRNLGDDINTKGNEVFPTVADADMIYYSSDSKQGLGGFDIYSSTRINGIWSAAVHLSYPINSSVDDFSMFWNEDKKSGYFTSDRSGSDRIYSFTEEDNRVRLEGLVSGKDSMLPLGGAKVLIKNLTDGTEQMVITDGDGKFSADLLKGKDYQISTELDGYFKESDKFSTKDGIGDDNEFQKVIELKELYVSDNKGGTDGKGDGGNNGGNDGKNGGGDGKGNPGDTKGGKGSKTDGTYSMPEIHWDYNKWDIRPDALPYLDNLVKLFKDNPDLKFELRSHTDCRGSFEYNDDLSAKRAKAAVDYLISKGVPRSIIVSKGYGEKELLNDCTDGVFCTEEQHEVNRRTEFIVTDKKKK